MDETPLEKAKRLWITPGVRTEALVGAILEHLESQPSSTDLTKLLLDHQAELAILRLRMPALESAASRPLATAQGSGQESRNPSSATAEHGTVERRFLLHDASLAMLPTLIQEAISACSKSMPYMLDELAANWIDSSTLRLTLRWPTPSGSTKAGSPGPVSHD